MKAAVNLDGLDCVPEPVEDPLHLCNSLLVGAAGDTNEHALAHHQHVAAIQTTGRLNEAKSAARTKRFGHGHRFASARCGTRPGDDGQLVEDNGGILDKHGIGHVFGGL